MIAVMKMDPYINTFAYHWIDKNGEVVPASKQYVINECLKWHAFCLACGAFSKFCHCMHWSRRCFVGAGEADTHEKALHLLNTMYLNHAFCEVKKGETRVETAYR